MNKYCSVHFHLIKMLSLALPFIKLSKINATHYLYFFRTILNKLSNKGIFKSVLLCA